MDQRERDNLMRRLLEVFDAQDDLDDAIEADEAVQRIKVYERCRLDAIEKAVRAGASYGLIARITGAQENTVKVAIQRRNRKRRMRAA
jgi:ribosome recycling factor